MDVEPDFKTGKYELMLSGLKKAESLFDKFKIKPTLFVTCDCIEKYPNLFRKLQKKGWEISLHGYRHLRFDSMSNDKKEEQISKAVSCFKKYLKISPKGVRAPQFSADFGLIKLLNKKAFKYDSSIVQFPPSQLIFFRKKLNLYLHQCTVKNKIKSQKLKIKEIPASSFILPISMFTLRKLPFFIFKILAQFSALIRKDKILVFFSHSYEYNNKIINKLEKFIKLNSKNKFVRMQDL